MRISDWSSDVCSSDLSTRRSRVVNIILNDKLDGLQLGAETGISSIGAGFRYRLDGAFGTSFAGGAGHFMIGAEYMKDEGIGVSGRADRPWFGARLVYIGRGPS